MTTQRIHGRIAFSCDRCTETFEPPQLGVGSAERDWQETWEDAKAAGWRAIKTGNEWSHHCPSCAGGRTQRLPLNGTKTHALSDYSRGVLRAIAKAPMPTQEVNPGVVNRLMRDALVHTVKLKSPYKTHQGAAIDHLEITEAGRAVL